MPDTQWTLDEENEWKDVPICCRSVSARKDEKVAVVVDHDKPGDEAIEVRFEAAQ